MKALVLSGGAGTRLRPFSYSMPKQLIPVAGKPVLVHAVENLRALGITEIGIVVGGHAAEIAAALGDGSRFGVRVSYIRQDVPHGLADCVRLARDFLADDDFVMYLGDNVLPGGLAELAEGFLARRPAAHVAVKKVGDPSSFGVVQVDGEGRAVRLWEKPAHPVGDLAIMGVYFFTPAVHEAVAAIRPSARGELEITDAIQQLVSAGHEVRVHEHHGQWWDTGKLEDLLECNRALLDILPPPVAGAAAGAVDAHSELVGPVILGPGARIVRSRIVGPAVIGGGSEVVDSALGPYTVIGEECRLSGAGVEDSIVLDRARIRQVRGIRQSVIGRAALVISSPRGGHRLAVGDHTTVEVAAA
ncbi:glucose-1-phosphate thymidylyltransferase [Streptomyces sp. CB03234]|uniref:glucose-1-phosphate thymidylyltransferase n=1 Tax=Streptomyces sp. (strain CB03234) TaxID=1703937 RepID=UPI00093FEA83|nr:glucose-1-phosphate thymidylyltransferase [Streptomyces sp. CB03234]OKJ94675.1 glucose-1-phosphate thymidylyltransferase [Streptomyces sp. CB03234]